MNAPNVQEIDISALPSVPFAERNTLPAISAIYFALSSSNEILYIGRTLNVSQRWEQHHRLDDLQQHDCFSIAWYAAPYEQLPTLEEAWLVLMHPPLNRLLPDSNYKRINVYLDDDLWLTFRKKCLENRCSASKMLATLLSEFLRETPPMSPQTVSTPVARSRARQAAKAGTST